MPVQSQVGTQPAQLVRAPSSYGLYFRLSVTNVAATLVSLLPNGVLPTIPVPNQSGPAGNNFVFKGVKLSSETDPGTTVIRYTDDGQTTPVIGTNLGFVVPGQPNQVVIMADPQDIKLVAAVAGPTFVQCYLIIGGTSTGTN